MARGVNTARARDRAKEHVLRWFVSEAKFKGYLKALLAFLVSGWVGLIDEGAVFGSAPYLVGVAAVFFHPARTLGAQVDATVLGIAGCFAGSAISVLCKLFSSNDSSTNREKSTPPRLRNPSMRFSTLISSGSSASSAMSF